MDIAPSDILAELDRAILVTKRSRPHILLRDGNVAYYEGVVDGLSALRTRLRSYDFKNFVMTEKINGRSA